MKLLGRTESKTTKNKNGEGLPHLEVNEVVLVIINKIQEFLIVPNIQFVPNRPFDSFFWNFSKISQRLKTFNSEFQDIGVWFTDQNNQSLEIK